MSTPSLPQHDKKNKTAIDGFNPPTQVCINDYWHGKPPTDAGRAIGEYHWRRVEVTPYELMQLVAEGKAFTALLGDQTHTSASGKSTGIHRTSTNFARLEYVGVDFDDGTSLEDILDDELARECGSFAYATASHTLQAPRSRLVFCLEAVIEDADLAAEVIAAIVWHYGDKRPDKGAKGAVRVWYGTKPGNPVRWIGGQLWASEVDRLLAAFRAAPEYHQPTDAAAGALADMVAEDLAPDLAKYGLKPQTLELIHNPADGKGGRSDADADIVRALWLANASIRTIFNVYEHYPCGQAQGTKYQERGRPYLEQQINGVIAWRTGWTNEDAMAWEAERRNEEPEHAPWAADGTTTTDKPTDGATGALQGFVQAHGGGYKRMTFAAFLKGLQGRANATYDAAFVLDCAGNGQRGDAELLTSCVGDLLLYFHPDCAWLWFDGISWNEVAENTIVHLTSELVAPLYSKSAKALYAQMVDAARAGDETEAKRLKDVAELTMKRASALKAAATVRKVLDFAKSNLLLGRDDNSAKWDSDINLLGAANGVVSLLTGAMVEPHPDQLIRTCAPVDFDAMATAPLWEQSILEVLNDDAALVGYVQRLFGYAMSGTADEAIFPVFYGEHGRNGKEFIMERLRHVLGDRLAGTAEPELLLASKYTKAANGSSEAVMTLRGRRIAWVSETNEGRNLDTAKMKDLSGGHILTGRHNHGRQQEWKRTHTPFMLTNHKPHVNSQGLAEWSRIRLIEFKRSFVTEPDPKQPFQRKVNTKLGAQIDQNEAPGILNWLIAGCIAWRIGGLQEPQSVKDATNGYRDAEDTLGLFIAECCITGDGYKVDRPLLFQEYKNWMDGNGNPMAKGTLFDKLRKRGFAEVVQRGTRVFVGIGLAATGDHGNENGRYGL